jgi:hypothetical protein
MSDIADSSSTNEQKTLLIGLQGKLTELGLSNQVHTFSPHTLFYLPRSLTSRLSLYGTVELVHAHQTRRRIG